jgi:hypothetical protein
MKMFVGTLVVSLLTPSFAFAENCPDNGAWAQLKQNMHWTVFDDADARRCYYNNAGDSAISALKKCNQVFDEGGQLQELNNCWPSFVCSWMKANGAPGC